MKCRKILLVILAVLLPLFGRGAEEMSAASAAEQFATSCSASSISSAQARRCCEPEWLTLCAAIPFSTSARKDRCRRTFDMGSGGKELMQGWRAARISAGCPALASLSGSADLQERQGAGGTAACCDTAAGTTLPHSPARLLIRITHDSHRHRQRGREAVVCNYKELWSAALWQHPGQAWRAVCDRLCVPCHPHRNSPDAKRAWAVRGLAWKGEKFSCSMSYLGR